MRAWKLRESQYLDIGCDRQFVPCLEGLPRIKLGHEIRLTLAALQGNECDRLM
jgi:hypothetical protein